ncbi:hypothetical protein HK099_003781 [Clydaea vesicula]|uniref:Adenylate kinase isoenzyme 6 homolog n=1 Tax=Clydaea vesicula TaxID=447962 RepID=A0AAD5U5V3_9FUNG|nr:hypothetical protein HK099_003781 [Clydaea vesicula]KAJ3396237.1 hypothetical protein HDU92_003695 [Lobulomyces angularis]
MTTRKLPNILITGTPGTGKTTTAELAADACTLKHIEVGKLVKELDLHDGYDKDFDSYYINEDKVCDELELLLKDGGCIVDYHGCDFFPERWFDLVVVLQTDNSVLYPRLQNRGYTDKKINENMECEIMQVIVEEARESYKEEIIVMLKSETVDDMESNVERLMEWCENWKTNNFI